MTDRAACPPAALPVCAWHRVPTRSSGPRHPRCRFPASAGQGLCSTCPPGCSRRAGPQRTPAQRHPALPLDGPHDIQKARIGAQGLEQEIPGPQRRELLCHGRIYLPRRNCLGIRSRAEVGKNGGTRLLCGLHSQLPACLRQLFPAGRVCRRQPGQAEGIRLDGISPAARYSRWTASTPAGSVRLACSHSTPGAAL